MLGRSWGISISSCPLLGEEQSQEGRFCSPSSTPSVHPAHCCLLSAASQETASPTTLPPSPGSLPGACGQWETLREVLGRQRGRWDVSLILCVDGGSAAAGSPPQLHSPEPLWSQLLPSGPASRLSFYHFLQCLSSWKCKATRLGLPFCTPAFTVRSIFSQYLHPLHLGPRARLDPSLQGGPHPERLSGRNRAAQWSPEIFSVWVRLPGRSRCVAALCELPH